MFPGRLEPLVKAFRTFPSRPAFHPRYIPNNSNISTRVFYCKQVKPPLYPARSSPFYVTSHHEKYFVTDKDTDSVITERLKVICLDWDHMAGDSLTKPLVSVRETAWAHENGNRSTKQTTDLGPTTPTLAERFLKRSVLRSVKLIQMSTHERSMLWKKQHCMAHSVMYASYLTFSLNNWRFLTDGRPGQPNDEIM